MDVKVLLDYVRLDSNQDGLYDLIEPYVLYRTDIPLLSYEVEEGEDMRIDLVFQSMYDLDPQSVGLYLDQIDIILNINNIQNPLNIQKGMILIYPNSIESIDQFRITEDDFKKSNDNLNRRLTVPNVSVKVDPKRKQFTDNNFSFPPTVLKNPKPPVSLQNGQIFIGGV
jgi:hypothetical protein